MQFIVETEDKAALKIFNFDRLTLSNALMQFSKVTSYFHTIQESHYIMYTRIMKTLVSPQRINQGVSGGSDTTSA